MLSGDHIQHFVELLCFIHSQSLAHLSAYWERPNTFLQVYNVNIIPDSSH